MRWVTLEDVAIGPGVPRRRRRAESEGGAARQDVPSDPRRVPPRREEPAGLPAAHRDLRRGKQELAALPQRARVPLRDLLPADAPPESGGLITALLGIRFSTTDDRERLRLAAIVFDLFYAAIRVRAERAAAEAKAAT